jgi:hypothetical protein
MKPDDDATWNRITDCNQSAVENPNTYMSRPTDHTTKDPAQQSVAPKQKLERQLLTLRAGLKPKLLLLNDRRKRQGVVATTSSPQME